MILGGLFDALVRNNVTLVFTSNVPPRDLYKNGLQRQRFMAVIELIERHTQMANVDGALDYRLRQLNQAGTYLPAGATDTPDRLDSLFKELSDGVEEQGGAIEIEGRRIPIVRASDNVAWFDFAALCEGPRSPADYIEIAREYQSVLVSGIPVFDEARENAARRFVALVDELYDRNVNLIVTAAAAPRALYRGERLQQEFRRTTSRLIEMQSQEYLARGHKP
jgi:cell division protein ZapE